MEKEVMQRDVEDKNIHLKLASLNADSYKNEVKTLVDMHKLLVSDLKKTN